MVDSEQARKADQVADSYYERIELGESYECESCGTNYDTIGVSQGDNGGWYVKRELGCYGGFASYHGTTEDAVERLESFITEELTGKKNKRNKRAVRGMIDEMLVHSNRK